MIDFDNLILFAPIGAPDSNGRKIDATDYGFGDGDMNGGGDCYYVYNSRPWRVDIYEICRTRSLRGESSDW